MLEIGAGCGVCGVVAAKLEAAEVRGGAEMIRAAGPTLPQA